jgi:hypothetical protein
MSHERIRAAVEAMTEIWRLHHAGTPPMEELVEMADAAIKVADETRKEEHSE